MPDSEMIHAVQERLAEMPARTRPKLLVFGESLGSYGTEQAFDDVDEMISGVDGALLTGPVFRNHIHNAVTDEREDGTPFWRPVYEDGEQARFAVAPADLAQPPTEWGSPRIVYLQNSSDPITYWSLDLLWRRPEWLDRLDAPRTGRLLTHAVGATRHVLGNPRRHGVLHRCPRRPRPQLRRESCRRVGGDRLATRVDRGEDTTPQGHRRRQVIRPSSPATARNADVLLDAWAVNRRSPRDCGRTRTRRG